MKNSPPRPKDQATTIHRFTPGAAAGTGNANILENQRVVERAIGIEPTTFSLGSQAKQLI
jgi:hypothetical protein